MSEQEGVNVDANGAEARIRQLINDKKALEARVASLEETAANADKWRTQIDELKATHKAEREAAALERQILAAGITDAEGIDVVQTFYGKLPADGRPPLGEWLAAKDALPRAVRAYIGEATATTTASTTTATTATMPRSNATAVTAPPAQPNAWSAEAIAKLSPAEFKANQAAIFASLGVP